MIHTTQTRAGILAAMAMTGAAIGQDWIKQAPSPTGKDVYNAAFIDDQLGFICGVNRTLIRTRDGGDSWETVFSGVFTSDPFYNVHFHDDLHGWVIGNNDGAHRTVDGGETWQQMTTVPAGSWREIVSFSPDSLVIGANGAMAATSNGGQNWEVRSGYPLCPIVYGMDYRDELVGLVSGDQAGPSGGGNGIYRTADGGRTWAKVVEETSNDVVFMHGDRALANVFVDFGGVFALEMWFTDDAGLTWNSTGFVFFEDPPAMDLERITDTKVAGISSQGAIWISENGGFSWEKRQEPVGNLPYGWTLSFSDELNGYASGPSGIILATRDGGFTWDMLQNGSGFTVEELQMRDERFGLAAAGSYVLRTEDGGQEWDLTRLLVDGSTFGRDESINAIDFVDESIVVAAGDGGIVFQSFDGGDSWTSIGYPNLPGLIDIESVAFVSASKGWVVGDTGMYRTTDGFFWEDTGLPFGIDVEFADEMHGWMQMPGGRQFRTIDGGDTWEDRFLPNHPRHGSAIVNDMDFVDTEHGWVVGWWGYAIKTTNGGQSWQFVDLGMPTQFVAQGVAMLSEQELWITGYERDAGANYVLHTIDGGRTWEREVVRGGEFTSTTEIDANAGGVWLAGFQGEIYHQPGNACQPDMDGDGNLTIFDFLAFQTAFDDGDPIADFDGDGSLTIFDFLAFQTAFDAGCD